MPTHTQTQRHTQTQACRQTDTPWTTDWLAANFDAPIISKSPPLQNHNDMLRLILITHKYILNIFGHTYTIAPLWRLTLSLSLSDSTCLSFSISDTLTRTPTHAHTLTHTHSRTHTHAHTLTHTHSRTDITRLSASTQPHYKSAKTFFFWVGEVCVIRVLSKRWMYFHKQSLSKCSALHQKIEPTTYPCVFLCDLSHDSLPRRPCRKMYVLAYVYSCVRGWMYT